MKSLQEQLRQRGEEAQAQAQLAQVHESLALELNLLVPQLQRKLEEQGSLAATLREQRQEQEQRLEQERTRAQTAHEEVLTLRRRLELRQAQGGGTSGGEGASLSRDEQLDHYRKLVRCSVCQDRPKGCVITRCFHLFCRPCLDDILAARHRKCPACSVAFGERDVHTIWL